MNPSILSILPAIAASGFISRKSESFGAELTRGIVTVGRGPASSVELEIWANAVAPADSVPKPSATATQTKRLNIAAAVQRRKIFSRARLRCDEPRGRYLCSISRTGLRLIQSL